MTYKRGKRKKNVLNEWEFIDIDKDEHENLLKFRDRRWKEIKLEEKQARELQERLAKKAKAEEKIREPTPADLMWLRADYVLSNTMEKKAYEFMYKLYLGDKNCYVYLFKIFVSKFRMDHIQWWVNFFASGNTVNKLIGYKDVIKHYREYKNIKTKITVKRKGEEDCEL